MPAPPDLERPVPLRKRGDEITGWRIRFYYWTRNPHLLFWAAFIILGVGVALGKYYEVKDQRAGLRAMFDQLRHAAGLAAEPEEAPVDLPTELLQAEPNLERVIVALRQRDFSDPARAVDVHHALQASRLPAEAKNIALAYWTSLCSGLGEPGADLLYFAHQPSPHPFANELAGDFWAQHPKKSERAVEHYQRELTVRPEATAVRKKIVDLHKQKENYAALATLQKDPAYASHFDAHTRMETAMRQHDWGAVWEPIMETQKRNFSARIPLILTSIAGAVWLLLAWQMAQVPGIFSFRFWAPLLAIPLGAVSVLPVLFLDVYQSEAWGLKHTGFFFEDCVFFLAGVGLREEFCKLLLFLPLVPVLLWRGSRLEMVVVAGCVGLGFAIEENLSYFQMADPSNAFTRFLTANFFHFAATGLVGLSFCDSIRNPRRDWYRFPVTFLAVTTAHGLYDAFISVPLYLFIALGMSCFIMVSLGFFRQVARERGAATDQFFPAATLILGLSVLVGAIIVCASMQYGFDFAMRSIAASAVFLGVFVYMFFVLFRDGLQEEAEVAMPTFDPL